MSFDLKTFGDESMKSDVRTHVKGCGELTKPISTWIPFPLISTSDNRSQPGDVHYHFKQLADAALFVSVLKERGQGQITWTSEGGGGVRVMQFIPQKQDLVFIKCFFLALKENKEVQIF